VVQEGAAEGLYADGWVQPKVSLRIRPLRPVTAWRLRGWRPDSASPQAQLIVHLNGRLMAQPALRPGVFELDLAGSEFRPRIRFRLISSVTARRAFRVTIAS
jgi:hypothetical protein